MHNVDQLHLGGLLLNDWPKAESLTVRLQLRATATWVDLFDIRQLHISIRVLLALVLSLLTHEVMGYGLHLEQGLTLILLSLDLLVCGLLDSLNNRESILGDF